ncbi:sulfatase-like hydrolase/transferase [Acidaminobacter sp. JC074]|uniref:sulfatase-like hydrolase/transferase n=1 Tax=Acidaminobacter sp. JC074 TaxID=2530199 RepID=UPI001F11476B|nr:sulfatase-like hydrolase/transferase [Acidaminobacter sp. JC074]
MKKHLVMIMTDHQRADAIGRAFDGKEVMPYLSSLARTGIKFNRAYTTCPLCAPARTALATGKWPSESGVIYNDWSGKTARQVKTIDDYLKDAGYSVGRIGVQHVKVKPALESRSDYDAFYTEVDYKNFMKNLGHELGTDSRDKTPVKEWLDGTYQEKKYSNTRVSQWPFDDDLFKDAWFVDKGIDFIEKESSKPKALFLNIWAPHPPLILPTCVKDQFSISENVLPSNINQTSLNEPSLRRQGIAAQLGEHISKKEWAKVWSAHHSLLYFADMQIKRLMAVVDKKLGLENVLFVFTSDHGDHLGQHQMYQKMEMYEQAINVPFIIRDDRLKRREVETCVSHLDLMPTVLGLLGIACDKLDGRDLSWCLENDLNIRDMPVYAQYSGNPGIGTMRRTIVDGSLKLTLDSNGDREFYNLNSDPLEMNNLMHDPRIQDMENDLISWCRNRQDVFTKEK